MIKYSFKEDLAEQKRHAVLLSMSFCLSVVVGRRGVKRKVTAAEGGPMRKRKRRLVTEDSEDSEHSEEEAKQSQ